MKLLFSFIKRFQTVLVFIFLQFFALNTYVKSLDYTESAFINSTWSLTSKIVEWKDNFYYFINLKHNNKILQNENVKLRKNQKNNSIQIIKDTISVVDTFYKQRYTYIPANVINSTISRRNNYFTLNIGRSNGIKVGQGVVSSNGIVGITYSVSENFCLVKSVLSKAINIAVEIDPNHFFGFLEWDGKSALLGVVSGVSNDVTIGKNNLIKTRGGQLFPKGINIGRVTKVEIVEGKPEWQIFFKFSEDYRKLQNVYVVKDLYLEEQGELENTEIK
tara:strand:- start:50 stop:874 length:825 start_codon:yes stop_codon:yes gene_type:complete